MIPLDPIELSILQADLAGSEEHEFEKLCEIATMWGIPIVDAQGTVLFTPFSPPSSDSPVC